MAEIQIRRTITIEATTLGDVVKWMNYCDSNPMATPLTEPVTLEIAVDDRSRRDEEEGQRR